jgi:cathepsin L
MKKRFGLLSKFITTFSFLVFFAGSVFVGSAAAQINYELREKNAPVPIKQKLTNLRREIQNRKFTFNVGYTEALDQPLEKLAGDIIPSNMAAIAQKVNAAAVERIRIDNQTRAAYMTKNRVKLPELELGCVAGLPAFDWRQKGKVTPVKNQGGCGSCWAFAVIGALESNYLIRNTSTTDESEQFILANSGAGSCDGGNRANANAFLVSTGTATEAVVPYTATSGPPNPGAATPYDAVTTGFVNPAVENPSVAELKQALCEYGPLSVSVNATGAFQAYPGGVFNENANDTTNHAVLLIGWNDSKGAWLIKNSWGTNWGETGGYGKERGYMWIAYGSNRIGRWAQWIRAKSTLYVLPPEFFKIKPLILDRPILRPSIRN